MVEFHFNKNARLQYIAYNWTIHSTTDISKGSERNKFRNNEISKKLFVILSLFL